MNITVSHARIRTVALFVVLAIFLAGCAATRQGVEWPAISALDYNGETKILVAYETRVELIEPSNGRPVRVLDEEGEAVLNSDGDPIPWRVDGSEIDNTQFFASPTIITEDDVETLLFPTYARTLWEVQISDGQRAGTPIAINDTAIAEAVVTDEFIYVPFRGGDLEAIDRSTLEEAWTLPTTEGIWAQPLFNEGVLYVPSVDHALYAIDAETGEEIWRVDLEGAVTSTPLLHEGHLYVGSYVHKLFKITLDGEIVAEHQGQNWIWGTPALMGDQIYYADLSGYVHALNVDDLSEVWSTNAATRGIRPGPLVTDEYVIVASRDGHLYWLNRATGEVAFDREYEGTPELLSNLLLLEENEAAGIPESIVVVASVDQGRLVGAFTLDNSLPVWVYGR